MDALYIVTGLALTREAHFILDCSWDLPETIQRKKSFSEKVYRIFGK